MIVGSLTLPTITIVNWAPTASTSVYASHDVIEGKPRQQYTAEGAGGGVLSVFFHRDMALDPDAMREALEAIRTGHDVVALQHDNGTILGTFVITTVAPTKEWRLADGFLLGQRLDITFLDPGLDDDVEVPPAGIAVSGGSVATTSSGPTEDLSTPPNAWSTSDIARR